MAEPKAPKPKSSGSKTGEEEQAAAGKDAGSKSGGGLVAKLLKPLGALKGIIGKVLVWKRLMVMGGIAVVVLGLLGGGGYYGWKKWQAYKAAKAGKVAVVAPTPPPVTDNVSADNSDDEDTADTSSSGGEGEGSAPPPVLIYKNNVNLEGHKNTYLVVEFDILFRDMELGRLATSDKPTPENSIMRSIILDAISGKTLEDASDLDTREAIRQDIKDRLNERFAPKPLKPGEKEDPKHKKPKHPIKDVLVISWAIAQ
jgi:flagellar protein FliL